MPDIPPLQEPWKLDLNGRIISEPWILWLLKIAGDQGFEDDIHTALGIVQGEQKQSSIKNEDDELLTWMSF